jgi:hypothetical protein
MRQEVDPQSFLVWNSQFEDAKQGTEDRLVRRRGRIGRSAEGINAGKVNGDLYADPRGPV